MMEGDLAIQTIGNIHQMSTEETGINILRAIMVQ